MIAEGELDKQRADRAKVFLADPNYQAYLDRREQVAKNLMNESSTYPENFDNLEAQIDAIVGDFKI